MESARQILDRLVLVLADPECEMARAITEASEARIVDNLPELIELMNGQERPVIMLDGTFIKESDLELLEGLPQLSSRPSMAILGTEQTIGESVTTARRLCCGQVLGADVLSHPCEIRQLIGWIEAGGPPFGLEAHLEPGTAIHSLPIRCKPDKAGAVETILDFVREFKPEQSFEFDLRLILEETINNAIFHAFRDSEGREKYKIATFDCIDDDEDVRVSYGADSKTIALSVCDNQGRLDRDTVLAKFERQFKVEGLMDENGRGLYLTYSLSGRLLFNLVPGEKTELVALFRREEDSWPEFSENRPVLVFER